MTHSLEARVYYEDTDAGGVMFYANHLKFAERGRTEYLRKLGFLNSALMSEQGVLFVVRRVEADYLKPARLDDLLTVQTALQTVKNTSFVMKQDIMRGDEHLCSMTVLLVCVSKDGKPVGIPAALKDAFNNHI
jgi:acyl-CoA thioester hydrolase